MILIEPDLCRLLEGDDVGESVKRRKDKTSELGRATCQPRKRSRNESESESTLHTQPSFLPRGEQIRNNNNKTKKKSVSRFSSSLIPRDDERSQTSREASVSSESAGDWSMVSDTAFDDLVLHLMRTDDELPMSMHDFQNPPQVIERIFWCQDGCGAYMVAQYQCVGLMSPIYANNTQYCHFVPANSDVGSNTDM
jgi:hypothetical protein